MEWDEDLISKCKKFLLQELYDSAMYEYSSGMGAVFFDWLLEEDTCPIDANNKEEKAHLLYTFFKVADESSETQKVHVYKTDMGYYGAGDFLLLRENIYRDEDYPEDYLQKFVDHNNENYDAGITKENFIELNPKDYL